MIRLAKPNIDERDCAAAVEVLKSGYLVQGPRVAAFEDSLLAMTRAPHAAAVSNCTAALHISLAAIGVGPGDIVICPAYSWLSTANVIELCGAHVEFIDIDPHHFSIDSNHLEKRLKSLMSVGESARRVKAIFVVHPFGYLADMKPLLEIAGRYDLPLIEDAACALGAERDGIAAGGAGVMGCYSFHPRKIATMGEGGAIVSRTPELMRVLKALRNHGLDPEADSPDFILPGFNYRLTEMQAAIGVEQLKKLPEMLATRRKLAARYNELLSGIVEPQHVDSPSFTTWQTYTVKLPVDSVDQRDRVMAYLREREVQTTIGTYHMPMTSYFRSRYGFNTGDFPNTDDVFARTIALPLHEELTEHELSIVKDTLIEALKAAN